MLPWHGLFAPRETPASVIARIDAELKRLLADPEVVRELADRGAEPYHLDTAAFRALVVDQTATWKRRLDEMGLKVVE